MNKYISELKEINNIIKRINEILKPERKRIQKNALYDVLKKNKYDEFEEPYINLSIEEKREVLDLVKELLEKINSNDYYKSNAKYIKSYLEYSCGKTVFDRLLENHKEPRQIPLDQVKIMHKKGLLTPTDKVRECQKMNYCLPNNSLRCGKYLSKSKYGCYDCLVDYCSVQDEWKPIMYDDYNDILDKRKSEKSYRILKSNNSNKDKS